MIEKFPLSLFIPIAGLQFTLHRGYLKLVRIYRKHIRFGVLPTMIVAAIVLFGILLAKYFIEELVAFFNGSQSTLSSPWILFWDNFSLNSTQALNAILSIQGFLYFIVLCILISSFHYFVKTKETYIVFYDFVDMSLADTPVGTSTEKTTPGKTTGHYSDLLQAELNDIVAMYKDVNTEGWVKDLREPNQMERPFPPIASLQQLKEIEDSEPILKSQSVSVGSFTIPIGAIIAFFSERVNGARLSGMYGYMGNNFVLSATMADPKNKRGISWAVRPDDMREIKETIDKKDLSLGYPDTELMVKILACKIFTELTGNEGSRRWEATFFFNEGLKFYRSSLPASGKKHELLTKACKNFSAALDFDGSYEKLHYNRGKIYEELSLTSGNERLADIYVRKATAEYKKELANQPRRWEAYYALAYLEYLTEEKHRDSCENCVGWPNNTRGDCPPIETGRSLEDAACLITISHNLHTLRYPEVFVTQGLLYLLQAEVKKEAGCYEREIYGKGIACLHTAIQAVVRFSGNREDGIIPEDFSFIRQLNILGLLYLNRGLGCNGTIDWQDLEKADYLFSRVLKSAPFLDYALYNRALVNLLLPKRLFPERAVMAKEQTMALIRMAPNNPDCYLLAVLAGCCCTHPDPGKANHTVKCKLIAGLKKTKGWDIGTWKEARMIVSYLEGVEAWGIREILGKMETFFCLLNRNAQNTLKTSAGDEMCRYVKSHSRVSAIMILCDFTKSHQESPEELEKIIHDAEPGYAEFLEKSWELGKIWASHGDRFLTLSKTEGIDRDKKQALIGKSEKCYHKAKGCLKDYPPEIEQLDELLKGLAREKVTC
ncbi:tetratricopeptide repeat protein [Methanoregula sp. UBA64]|uniref:tetratricopeptide repeat protein n=1 Tax=Methanoregula sp. UBA64 TaxID=1915554 RepID=UPI0025D445CD|nr:hypothetical protein [Methanoregula sp. UBA64]